MPVRERQRPEHRAKRRCVNLLALALPDRRLLGRWAALGVLLAALFSPVLAAKPAGTEEVRPGMEAEQVRKILGPPDHVTRQGLLFRCLEQWHYGHPHHLRLHFEHRRGQKSRLQSVRKLQNPHP